MEEDDPRLVFIPIEKAVVPPEGLIEHLKNRWWQVHPEKGLVFWNPKPNKPMKNYGFPQCNSNVNVSKSESLRKMYPWAEVVLIPSVFRPIDPHDFLER